MINLIERVQVSFSEGGGWDHMLSVLCVSTGSGNTLPSHVKEGDILIGSHQMGDQTLDSPTAFPTGRLP